MTAPARPPTDDLAARLAPAGLVVICWTTLAEGEGPLLPNGETARSVALIGNAGGSLWPAFSAWLAANEDVPHPLDRWSKQVIGPVAELTGGTAFYPSDPPYQPFQRWAMAALGIKPSPLGLLVHPDYGLWFGFRGALAFRERLADVEAPASRHPCDRCIGKPCLTVCPAGAVTAAGFSVSSCRGYLAGGEGRAGCLKHGCLARDACPVGKAHRYPEGQIRFHMRALDLPSV